jgi:hypothetical protein
MKKHQIVGAWVFGSILLVFLAAVFVYGPNELPAHKHLMLGVFCALLSGLMSSFILGTLVISGKIPEQLLGLDVKAGGGLAVFVLVFLIWNTKLNPIQKSAKPSGQKTNAGASFAAASL